MVISLPRLGRSLIRRVLSFCISSLHDLRSRLGLLSLQRLGQIHGTDKADHHHSFKGRSYLDIYEGYFRGRRRSVTQVLEIGVLSGNSLRMWADYFPIASVTGLDIDPGAKRHASGRIGIEIGSQGDLEFLAGCCAGVKFDVVIDDGSHINELTIKSFEGLFSRVKPGGLYIIEDLRCSYDKLQTEHGIRSWWPGMAYNSNEISLDNDRASMDEFFRRLILPLDHQRGDVEFVHFWSQVCVIGKVPC